MYLTLALKFLDNKTLFFGVIGSFPDLWSIGFDLKRTLGFTDKYDVVVISTIYLLINLESAPIIYGIQYTVVSVILDIYPDHKV